MFEISKLLTSVMGHLNVATVAFGLLDSIKDFVFNLELYIETYT